MKVFELLDVLEAVTFVTPNHQFHTLTTGKFVEFIDFGELAEFTIDDFEGDYDHPSAIKISGKDLDVEADSYDDLKEKHPEVLELTVRKTEIKIEKFVKNYNGKLTDQNWSYILIRV